MKFSIITIVLNDLPGLQRTYRSVEAQSTPDYEWLVIDGGSGPDLVDWLRQLNSPRSHWWSESDRGLYHAMNKGIDRATGDYLLFLNAGDELASPDVLERVAAAIDAGQGLHFVYGDSIQVDGQKAYYKPARSHRAIRWTMFGCHQAMFFLREHVGSQRYREVFPTAADYAFVAEFLGASPGRTDTRTLQLDFPVCRFWMGGRSWHSRRKTIAQERIIRRDYMGVPAITNFLLYVGHQIHTSIKRTLPGLARLLRKTSRTPID